MADSKPTTPETDRVEAPASTEPAMAPIPPDDEAPRLDRAAVSARLSRNSAQERYGVEGLLGVGANGRVYSVADRDLGRAVALKVLATATDREAVGQFLDEARIAASLTHPNVLPVHDIDVDHRGRPYFTMPRIEGRALANVLEQSTRERRAAPLADINAIVSMAIGVCQALGYAHHRAIVHQDIKPENIVLGDFGEVLLVDWGSAIRLDGEGPPRLYGTPLYMSPEQARRDGVDRRSDIYGLGATLFHALFLRPPTWADEVEEFWRKKRSGIIDLPQADEEAMAPAALTAIALKAMAADPAARYQSADAMLADLRAYQAGLAVSAYRDTIRAAIARWYRRNRRAVWTAVVTLSFAAVVAGFLIAEKRKEMASWHLIYGPGFPATAEALAKDWSAQKEDWWQPHREQVPLDDAKHFTYRDGALHVRGPTNGWIDVYCRTCPLGAVRIDWDYLSPDVDRDFNCFIGGADRMSGYTLHIGSWGNPSYVALTQGKDYEVLDNSYLPEPLQQGRTYHFALEKDGGHLHLAIDGRTVFEFFDPDEIYGDAPNTFGFDCVGPFERVISHVAIQHRPLPQRVSPLIVGDKLLQLGDYKEAEGQFLDLARSYPGTDIAREALFRQAVCALRADETARGLRLLGDFERDNPSHELIPYALYERLQVARKAHDAPLVFDLRTRLGSYRRHPLLRKVINQVGQDHMGELTDLPAGGVADPQYSAESAATIAKTYAELKQWGKLYGVSWWSNMYCFTSWHILEHFGQFRTIAESYPTESTPANDARLRLGLYDDVLRLTTEPYQRAQAQFALGRSGDRPEDGPFYWQTLLDREGPAAVVDRAGCDLWIRATALLQLGRYDEVLREYSTSKPHVVEALIALRRYDEVGDYNYPPGEARALLAQDRFDELIAKHPREYETLYRAVLRMIALGQSESAHALLADLQRAQVPLDAEPLVFARQMFPVLLRIDEGERLDLHAALAEPLARMREIYGQRLWQTCAYVAGDIDDAAFRAQPTKRNLELHLAWARALRADHLGRRDEALADYRAFAAEPRLINALDTFERDYLRWRITRLDPQPTAPATGQ